MQEKGHWGPALCLFVLLVVHNLEQGETGISSMRHWFRSRSGKSINTQPQQPSLWFQIHIPYQTGAVQPGCVACSGAEGTERRELQCGPSGPCLRARSHPPPALPPFYLSIKTSILSKLLRD
eukprot:scaffold2619_cov129-Skeletonema_dohrnii-CCMP3373.AAC.3